MNDFQRWIAILVKGLGGLFFLGATWGCEGGKMVADGSDPPRASTSLLLGEGEGSDRSISLLAGFEEASFDPAVGSRVEVRRARTGHLLTRVRVDGVRKGWFILDSGAGAWCIAPELAAEAKLESTGASIVVEGVGGGGRSKVRRGRAVTLGPLTLTKPSFMEIDLRRISGPIGANIQGIVGYELFLHAVVEVDLRKPALSLYRREDYTLPRGEWEKLLVVNRLPCVEAEFEGDRSGVFRIDTGAGSGTVMFHRPAVEELKLLENRRVRSGRGRELYGQSRFKSGEIDYIRVGARHFEQPWVTFSLDEDGAMAESATTGTLGPGLLRHFVLVFDYSAERIAFLSRGE